MPEAATHSRALHDAGWRLLPLYVGSSINNEPRRARMCRGAAERGLVLCVSGEQRAELTPGRKGGGMVHGAFPALAQQQPMTNNHMRRHG